MIKQESQRTCGTQISIKLVEYRTNITYSTSSVVGQRIHQNGNSVWTIAFISYFLIIALVFTKCIFDSTVNVVLRHVLTLSISNDGTQCRVVFWLWSTCFHSNGDLFTNLRKCTSHVSPTFQFCCFTIFKCSSH